MMTITYSFSYGYAQQQISHEKKNTPPLMRILMAMAMRPCNTERIAQYGRSSVYVLFS